MSSTTSTVLNKPIVRDSGIEMLRMLAACGVVILHYNGSIALSLVREGSMNSYILLFLEGLFICAVNVFVLISGYFLSGTTRRRAIKAIELVVQVAVMGLGLYIGSSVLSGSFKVGDALFSAIPNNYFMSLYITLYLVSPYINLAINKLSDKNLVRMAGLFLLLFSVWPTLLDVIAETSGFTFGGLYTTNASGSQFGYSIVNFALMYLLGAVLKRKNFAPPKYLCLLALLACVAVLLPWQLYMPQIARAYCNPLVVLLAVLVFLLFRGFTFKSRLINTLSKSAFTCFLIHGIFLSRIKIELFVNASPILLLLHILASAVAIYLVSFAVWAIYDFVTKPIFKLLGSKFGRLDALLSTEQSI